MKGKLLFLFPGRANSRIAEVEQGLIPSERLYGLIELRQRGWNATVSDSRWEGSMAKLRQHLKRFYEIPCLTTIIAIKKADTIVVKDDFSTTLLMESKLAGKPLVYLDAMFELPRRWRRQNQVACNLKHADVVCCYSKHQATLWAKAFNLPLSRFEILPYCIDPDFYPYITRRPTDPPYVLSVGRDLGRDYSTLMAACEEIGIAMKLVTLPYLLPEQVKFSSMVEVLHNVSYSKLFDLYAGASMAVVPLKNGITYPSGIRALLESTAIGVPTVVSKTVVLPEYLNDFEHVRYVLPENVKSLVNTMKEILYNPATADKMALRGAMEVRRKYSTRHFTDIFEQILISIQKPQWSAISPSKPQQVDVNT